MPFMDPAFAAAVCRYDLSAGAIKLNAPVSQAYTSVTFYTRNSVAYYAINDRAAGRRTIELDLMTPEQHAQVPEEEDVTAADRLIIESPTKTGLIVLRALGAGARTDADGAPGAGQRAVPSRPGAVVLLVDDFAATTRRRRQRGETRQRHDLVAGDLLLQLRSSIRSASAATGIGSATVRCSSA